MVVGPVMPLLEPGGLGQLGRSGFAANAAQTRPASEPRSWPYILLSGCWFSSFYSRERSRRASIVPSLTWCNTIA